MQTNYKVNYKIVSEGYYLGTFGGLEVLIRKEDEFVNATKLCKKGGKELFSWTRLQCSKSLRKEFSLAEGICEDEMINTVLGGKNTEVRGTYVHPDLVPHIAMWISPRFGIIVSRIIREWRELSSQNEANYWTEMGDCIINYPSEKDQEEKKWQELVAAQEQGTMEVETFRGRIDVLTPTKVIEVKRADFWKHAVGQVLCYRREYKDRAAAIYLFDSADAPKDIIREDCEAFGIEVKFLE